MEFSLLGAAAIAVVGVYLVLWWEAGRTNAADCTRDLWDRLVTAGIFGLLVGRLAAMVGGGVNPITQPADILVVRGGVSTGWAAVAALGTLGWLSRRDLWADLDAAAPAAIGGLAAWQGACLTRNACLGTPSDLPWAFAQSGSEIGRHPVELYAALGLAAAVVALIVVKRRRLGWGVAAGLALAAAGSIRLATEPMRPVIGGGPEWWYLAATAVGVGVAVWRTRVRSSAAP